ncbi:MAG: mechanosensitive ion channel family protein [Anaerovoracaceae bacterium]|jgi:miniconductance mechanosensitive channel
MFFSKEHIYNILINNGVENELANHLTTAIIALAIIILCFIVYYLVKSILNKVVSKYIYKSRFKWDDIALKRQVFTKITKLIPGIIVFFSAPVFEHELLIQKFASIYILIMSAFVIKSVLDTIDDIYRTYPVSKTRPIKGLLQVVMIIVYIITLIIIIAIIIEKSPLILLSGIGALTAVFSLVFKDTILGLVAGIQLTSNDMLRIGDWIEMGKYNADGTVLDVALTSVKVQNFDNTFTTIPTYALVSDSFINWRGMQESGGRRIKRSIFIDMNSIKFCTKDMIERFKNIEYLSDYISSKEKEIEEYNKIHNVDSELSINGRKLTNIGVFRIYIQNYLMNNPNMRRDMTLMVRQLQPTELGLPLEIYGFYNGTVWKDYENTQSDIFDHILASTDEFQLRVFQAPSGFDIKQMK